MDQITRVGAYVVCVRDGLLLLSRFARSHRWTLPGGGLDHGERPEDAAVREVLEETGYRIGLGPLVGVDSARWDRGHDGRRIDMHALRIIYTGEIIGGDLRHEVAGSTDRAEWVPLAQLDSLNCSSLIGIGIGLAAAAA